MFKVVSCINRVPSWGTSSLNLHLGYTPLSPPLQLVEQNNTFLGKVYSTPSEFMQLWPQRAGQKKQELPKIVAQKHKYKMWVAEDEVG